MIDILREVGRTSQPLKVKSSGTITMVRFVVA